MAYYSEVGDAIVERQRMFHIIKLRQKVDTLEPVQIIARLTNCESMVPRKFNYSSHHIIHHILAGSLLRLKRHHRLDAERISKFFSPGTPAQKIEDTIVKALEMYRRRQREMER